MFSCFVILKESNLRDYPSYSVSIYKWLEEHRLRQLCSLYTLYKWFQEHRLRQLCSLYTLICSHSCNNLLAETHTLQTETHLLRVEIIAIIFTENQTSPMLK